MRLLDRYLLRELLVPLGYCLGGFLIFWISFDMISEVDEFQRNKLKVLEVAQYYGLRLPEFIVLIGPIGLLLAVLYALTHHAKHNELTAMRAAGISLWRVCAPYLGVGLFLSVALVIVSEFIAPYCSAKAEQVFNQHVAARNKDRSWLRGLSFVNSGAGRSWYIEAYNRDTSEMIGPHINWTFPNGSRRVINAARGGRTGDTWVFFDVHEQIYSNRSDAVGSVRMTNTLYLAELSETPAQIESELKISSLSNLKAAQGVQLSVPEILNYIALHPVLAPAERAKLHTQLHSRLASPWTCLVVVLIAIPFGAVQGRRNAVVGVASSIFICFAFFVLARFGMALGTGGHVPPWLGAWGPNIFFGLAGIFLTLRTR